MKKPVLIIGGIVVAVLIVSYARQKQQTAIANQPLSFTDRAQLAFNAIFPWA